MPSQLTRHVFNCLITNQTIIHRGCLRQRAYSSISQWRSKHRGRVGRASGAHVQQTEQRRSLFGIPGFTQRAVYDDPSFAPGMEMMTSLAKRQRMRARLIPVAEIEAALAAFLKFMLYKRKTLAMPDTQAQLVLMTLRYILQARNFDVSIAATASNPDLQRFRTTVLRTAIVLGRTLKSDTDVHVELARFLIDCSPPSAVSSAHWDIIILTLIRKLCSTGRALEARQIYLDAQAVVRDGPEIPSTTEITSEQEVSEQERGPPNVDALTVIARALADEDNEAELLKTVDLASQNVIRSLPLCYSIATKFYASRKDTANMKKWYDQWQAASAGAEFVISPRLFVEMLRQILICCHETGELDLGNTILDHLSADEQPKEVCDEILAWGFANHRSVDEVSKSLDLMKQRSRERLGTDLEPCAPDIATINRLIEVAIAENNPYMAERLIVLGQSRGIMPNARTLALQMEYRLSISDVDGALVAYQHLQSQDLSSDQDVAVVNRLIVALCKSGRHDFDTIMNVAADLSDRKVSFDSLTVQTLCLLHLKRDELADVEDLLKTHANNFPSSDRASLRKAIQDFCSDPDTPVANSWDAYKLLREKFDEMPREERIELMQAYFVRERPDMAAHVFSHMRQHSREDTIPNIESYVAAFLGCAKARDSETLRAIHNQLKLDVNIDVSTRLRNALMIALASCGQGAAAFAIWYEIAESQEGPSYKSLLIALQLCQRTASGDVRAQQIWTRLRKNKIALDRRLWGSYLAALGAHGNLESAVRSLEQAQRNEEVVVDDYLLTSLWRAVAMTPRRAELEAWATATYPELWKELMAPSEIEIKGRKRMTNRLRTLPIDQTVTP